MYPSLRSVFWPHYSRFAQALSQINLGKVGALALTPTALLDGASGCGRHQYGLLQRNADATCASALKVYHVPKKGMLDYSDTGGSSARLLLPSGISGSHSVTTTSAIIASQNA